MKSYFILLKLMLRHGLRSDRSNGKKRNYLMWFAYAAIAVTYVIFTTVFIVPFSFVLGQGFGDAGMVAELVTFFLLISAGPVLVLGLIALISTLYFSRDAEFFAYLPVRGNSVFFAKLTMVYLIELILAAAMALPMIIAAGIGADMSPLYYLFAVLGIVIAPLLVLLIAAIISLPAMYIVSFFKARGAATSIAVILLFAVIMAGYSIVVGLVSSSPAEGNIIDYNQITETLVEAMSGGLGVLRYVLLPLYALVALGTGQSLWGQTGATGIVINIILFITITAFIVAVAAFISGSIYQKGAAAQLEGKGNAKQKKGRDTINSARQALTKREWREMFRTPSFAFQCLAGAVITPVVTLMMVFGMRSMFVSEEPLYGLERIILSSILPLLVMYLTMIMGVNLNTGASTIISREGKSYYYAKIMPVDYKTQFDAKIRVYFLLSAISVVGTVAFAIAIAPTVWYHFLAMSGFLAIYVFSHVHFAASFDLADPKLNWTNPSAAVKNSKNVLIPYFTGMGISTALLVLVTVPYILISFLFPNVLEAVFGTDMLFHRHSDVFSNIIAAVVSWALLYTVVIIMAVLFRKRAMRNLTMWYERMYS